MGFKNCFDIHSQEWIKAVSWIPFLSENLYFYQRSQKLFKESSVMSWKLCFDSLWIWLQFLCIFCVKETHLSNIIFFTTIVIKMVVCSYYIRLLEEIAMLIRKYCREVDTIPFSLLLLSSSSSFFIIYKSQRTSFHLHFSIMFLINFHYFFCIQLYFKI